jgi:hypothetical protein
VVFEPQLKEVAVIGRKIYVRGEVGGEKLEIMRVELGITTRAWRLK